MEDVRDWLKDRCVVYGEAIAAAARAKAARKRSLDTLTSPAQDDGTCNPFFLWAIVSRTTVREMSRVARRWTELLRQPE